MRNLTISIGVLMLTGVSFQLISAQSNRAQVSPSNVLDVSGPRPPGRSRGIGGGIGGSDHDQRPVMAPFKVTLLGLDRSKYRLNDRVIFEMMLENMTGGNVVIPWSADRDTVDPDDGRHPPGYVDAFVDLVVDDTDCGRQTLSVEMLFGSQLVPSSLKDLRPGERVIIRAAGFVGILDSAVIGKILAKLPTTYNVRGRFEMLIKNQGRPFV
jgi:hypothetical protein